MTPPLLAPFVAERYAAIDRLSAFVAPPYDVVTATERARLAEDPDNIVHFILPDGQPDPYTIAAETLNRWRQSGVVVRDGSPSVTVLRQELATRDGLTHVRTGVIGGVAVEAFTAGRVKPHERTHAGPKEDRLALLRATQAMFEALLFFSRDAEGDLQRSLLYVTDSEPTARAVLDGVSLTVWSVEEDQAAEIATAASAGPLYVGDGHHRYETAVQYRAENPGADRVPGLVVPLGDAGLVVLPTHRLLYGEPLDVDTRVRELGERFQIRELSSIDSVARELVVLAERGTACAVVFPGPRVFTLVMKPSERLEPLLSTTEPAVASLDVFRIDELVIPLLASDAASPSRLGYSADAEAVEKEIREGRAVAAVLLNATKVEQVLAVADAGAVMPQKSTYFTPKVPSGIVGISYAP